MASTALKGISGRGAPKSCNSSTCGSGLTDLYKPCSSVYEGALPSPPERQEMGAHMPTEAPLLRNYLKVAVRILIRYPGYSFINIVGLGIGLMIVVLIGIYVRHEFSYDRDHPHVERIHRILRENFQDGSSATQAGLSGALVPVIRESFPEVEATLRLWPNEVWVRVGNETYRQVQVMTERPFFEFFNFPLIEGSPDDLLEAGAAFVTMSMARKLFGYDDPIGKVFTLEDEWFPSDYVVRGILKDPPPSSSIRFDFLMSDKSVANVEDNWIWNEWLRAS